MDEFHAMKEAERMIQRQRMTILGLEIEMENKERENKILWMWVTILSTLILGYGIWEWIF